MQALIKRALLVTALLPGMSVAAPLQRPASADDIAAAVGDCWTAVGPNTVERAKLEARGWKAGSPSSSDGKPSISPIIFYGKTGSNIVIMLGGPPGNPPMCTVLSSVASLQEINKAAGSVQRTLLAFDPKVTAARSGGSIVFISLPRIAMLDPTGTKDKPATRITVGYQTPEKK